MHHDAEDVQALMDAIQHDAIERPGGEIERAVGFLREQRERVGFAGDVDDVERDRRRRRNALNPAAVDGGKRRAQDLVTPADLGHGEPQARDVEFAFEAQRARDVVGGRRAFQLREEPQPLLRKGQRQVVRARAGRNGAGRRTGVGRRRFDQVGHRADGLEFEDRVDADLDGEAAPDPRDQLHGLQRIAAVVEEAAGEIDGRIVEHVAPDAHQFALNRRGVERGFLGRGGRLQGQERRAIQLAVGVEREFGDRDDVGRDHVVRQLPGQVGPQVRHAQARGALDVGRQLAHPVGGFAQHDRRADDVVVRGDRGLDLAEFDTVPADLDLVVDASVALDTSVGQPPADVAGAIDARFAGKRMLDEFRGGDVGPLVVAACKAGAGEADFPGHAERNRPQRVVEHVHPGVGDGTADQHRGRRVLDALDDAADRRLGGTVLVVDFDRGIDLAQRGDVLGRQFLAAHDHLAHAGACQVHVFQQVNVGGRELEGVDAAAGLEHPGQDGVDAFRLRIDAQRLAAHQRAEDVGEREVEAERAVQAETAGRVFRKVIPGGPRDVVGQVPVFEQAAFGFPGRARRVEHVGQVRRFGTVRRVVRQRLPAGEFLVKQQRHAGEFIPLRELTRFGHQQRQAGVAEDVIDPLGRIRRVQRNERRPCLQDAENRDDHPFGTVEHDADQRFRPDAVVFAQVMREAVGPGVQVGVGHQRTVGDQGRRRRRACDLGFEHGDDRRVAGAGRRGFVERGQQRALFRRGRFDVADGAVEVFECLQHRGEAAGETVDDERLDGPAVTKLDFAAREPQVQLQIVVPTGRCVVHPVVRQRDFRELRERHVLFVAHERFQRESRLGVAVFHDPGHARQVVLDALVGADLDDQRNDGGPGRRMPGQPRRAEHRDRNPEVFPEQERDACRRDGEFGKLAVADAPQQVERRGREPHRAGQRATRLLARGVRRDSVDAGDPGKAFAPETRGGCIAMVGDQHVIVLHGKLLETFCSPETT
ncbi:hypothetical protein BCO18430_07238 [Burkholderia contaminans]|nr:hypothetical protein BCO18430_07238 [Burkholderia contaminans]